MWKFAVLLIGLSGYCLAGPVGLKRNMPIVQQRDDSMAAAAEPAPANVDPNEMMIMSTLSLPSNATSIRADITDGFSCANKTYGYYADVENDCQIFHVCLPVTYADGKENTFRWSFICPEETIFSQDSFTCMRPDDMTISCEESYQYYELNRNFGMSDKENNNEANNEPSEAVASNETILEAENEPQTKPVVQANEEEEEKVDIKPIGQPRPVKPLRRKPTVSFAAQKKPMATYPLRKIPQTQAEISEKPLAQNSEDVKESVVQPVEEEEIKPLVQKFSRRPAPVMSNTFKDKMQNSKPETVIGVRTELFNQNRKRPSMFNKKPVEVQNVEKEEEEEQAKIEIQPAEQQQNFSPVDSEMSNINTETQVADSEIQASESNHVFVKPEVVNDAPQMPAEPVQVLEAFEEIPAVISEVVETPNAEEQELKNEETLVAVAAEEPVEDAVETQEIQQVQIADDTPKEEEQVVEEETQVVEEDSKANGEKLTVEEEIQTPEAETQTAEEIQPALDETQALETQMAEEVIQTADETQEAAEIPDMEATQNLSSSAEVAQTASEVQTDEEPLVVAEEETQAAEETENVQTSDEETHVAEEIPAVEQIPAVEDVQPADQVPVAEEVEAQIPEEVKIADETQNVQEVPVNEAAEEQTVDEVPVAQEEIPTVEETQTAEEIPINVDESVQEIEKTEESQSDEITQNNEQVPVAQVVEKIEENQSAEQNQEVQQSQTPEETLMIEEPQPVEVVVPMDEDSKIVEEMQPVEIIQSVDENKASEENEAPKSEEIETVKSENDAEPTIFEQNSEEAVNVAPAQTIEEMESEKPAEAPETMQATNEMNQPNAMVQQMFEDMADTKQSIGGFKPVDPVMAHEAEQLIADFIHTLRNSDFTNETPGMHVEQHIVEEPEEQQSHEGTAEVEEAEKVENNEIENTKTENEVVKQEDEHEPQILETQADSVENNNEEIHNAEEVEEPAEVTEEETQNQLKSLEAASIENVEETQKSEEVQPELHMNLPQEMYQIPVQVITTPLEVSKTETEVEPAQMAENSENQVEEETPAMVMGGYKPLSIDDIVELVKERLDQMPKNEMETPMQLEQVLGANQEDKAAQEENLEEETQPESQMIQSEEQQEQQQQQQDEEEETKQSEEEIVMPIYQRFIEPVKIDTATQTENEVVNEAIAAYEEDADDAQEKASRSYSSRSMMKKLDPRKRLFLFKSDSS